MDRLVIALAQMDIHQAEPSANRATAHQMVSQAAQAGAHLVVLPELWGSGYDLKRAAHYATDLDTGLFAEMAAWAQKYNLYVAGSLLEAGGDEIYNTLALFGPTGLVASYRKIHLIGLMAEDRHLGRGDRPTLCRDLPWGPTGLALCYDLRFPELFRSYGVAGARLVILSAQWPAPRIEHWRVLLRARAIENQCVVAACNRVGTDPHNVFTGASAVVGPDGTVLVEGDTSQALFMATVDLGQIAEMQALLPVFHDRRPDCYSL